MVRPVQAIIAGAQKAGTSSVFRYLGQHPTILTHAQREMPFFLIDNEYNAGYPAAQQKYFPGPVPESHLILAKHAMAMYSARALERLKKHNPGVKVILFLRDPIKRAYSAYWYARRRGWETSDTFEAALEAEPLRLEDGWLRWRNCAYVYNSIYYPHVKAVQDLFGPAGVRVCLTEDLQKGAASLCRDLFDFLEVETDFIPDVEARHNQSAGARSERLARMMATFLKPENILRRILRSCIPNNLSFRLRNAFLKLNEKEFAPPPLATETRCTMAAALTPFNNRLAELIERDLSHWNA